MMFILAQETIGRAERLRGMQDRFRSPAPEASHQLLQILVLLGVLVVSLWIVWHIQQHHGQTKDRLEPMKVYRRVQAALGLSYGQRWLLWKLARRLRLEHPTAVLICAAHFDRAVEQYCSAGGLLGRRRSCVPHFAAIRVRLFGDEPSSA